MKRIEYLESCLASGVVAVVRGDSAEESYQTAVACIKGGVTNIELAFTAPHADQTIQKLNEQYADDQQVVIGAGTVLDTSTARMAIVAGAKFVVSPSFSKEVAKMCNLYQIPYLPGCQSPREIQMALEYGADIIKVFPANILGVDFFGSIKHGPFPQAALMPSGGVDLDNMSDWFDHGAEMVSAGGNLTAPAKTGDFESVTSIAKQYHEKWLEIKLSLSK